MELCALVHVDDPVGGAAALPDGVVQEGLDAGQNHLETRIYNLYRSNVNNHSLNRLRDEVSNGCTLQFIVAGSVTLL